jgi:hypothetical protein
MTAAENFKTGLQNKILPIIKLKKKLELGFARTKNSKFSSFHWV